MIMKKNRVLTGAVFLLLFTMLAGQGIALGIHGKEYFKPIHTIVIENQPSGRILINKHGSSTWETAGKVVYACQKVNPKGYTASKWAKPSSVAACAVNAIHIKTGDNTFESKGVVFSLLPSEMANFPGAYNSFLSPDSSIYTDINAGTSVFGGPYSPYVGSPVYFKRGTKEFVPLPEDYIPEVGDMIMIKVLKPVVYPKSIIFENREGGNVRLVMSGDQEQVIGEVIKPVHGVGRFQGTVFASVGRIRANHTGVIDVSTSAMNRTGGFQVIPSGHALSPEMENALKLTQWMVVAPVPGYEEFLEGMPPLFSGYIRPVYSETDFDSDRWLNDLLGRFVADVRFKDGRGWEPMPEFEIDPDQGKQLPGWASGALENVTHIRILFPVEYR